MTFILCFLAGVIVGILIFALFQAGRSGEPTEIQK